MREYTPYIGGDWIPAVDGAWIEDRNPADGEVVARIQTAGPHDLERALSSRAGGVLPAGRRLRWPCGRRSC